MAAVVPPGFDEAYYGVYAFHPGWGYFDHPPMVAVTAGVGMWLTGVVHPFTLRLGALLLFLGTAGILYRLVREIKDEQAALWSVMALHVTPYFLFGMGAFVIPDNALGFFWMSTLYFLWKIHRHQQPRYFLAVGATVGLALLSKYHGILLIGCIGFLLLFFSRWRPYLRSPYPYLGFMIALVIFSPNIWWNAQHDWISYRYQFGKSGGGNISFTLLYQAILVQMAYLLPWMAVAIWVAAWRTWRQQDENNTWLLPFVVFPILIFTLIGATRPILPHWPMPGYLGGMALLPALLRPYSQIRRLRWLQTTGGTTLLLGVVVIVQAITGILPLPLKADVTLDGQGWSQVVARVEQRADFSSENSFLFTHKWFTGGEVAFADANHHTVTVFNPRDPGHFPFWVNHHQLVGKTGFFIDTNRYPASVVELLEPYFVKITAVDTLQTHRWWGKGQQFIIWKCENYRGNFPFPYGEKK